MQAASAAPDAGYIHLQAPLPSGSGAPDCRQTLSKQKASQSFSPRTAKNQSKSVFSGDMCLGKNSSQPANVRASHGSECAAAGCNPSVGKAFWLCRQLEQGSKHCPVFLYLLSLGKCYDPVKDFYSIDRPSIACCDYHSFSLIVINQEL